MSGFSSVSKDGWRTASQQSFFRWPATFSLAGSVVCLLNLITGGNTGLTIGSLHLRLFDAFCLFACALVATAPVWYHATKRIILSKPKPSGFAQLFASLMLLICALLVAPHFELELRDYDSWSEDDRHDFTTTLAKRSILETLALPSMKIDELAWLQSNYSASYIPAQIFCPRRSTRIYPFFGIVWDDYLANALAPNVGDSTDARPPVKALQRGIERCRKEGPAMLAAGLTKESALLKGDIERFFTINALEKTSKHDIVLEEADIPIDIMRRIESILKPESEFDFLADANFRDNQGQVRRLRTFVLAQALGRAQDVTRLRGSE